MSTFSPGLAQPQSVAFVFCCNTMPSAIKAGSLISAKPKDVTSIKTAKTCSRFGLQAMLKYVDLFCSINYLGIKVFNGLNVTGPIKPDGFQSHLAAVNKPSAPRESRPCDGKLVL